MRARLIVAAVAGAVVVAGGGAAAAIAATTSPAPAAQPLGNDVYACVKTSGAVDYLEFRDPLPHACNSGDALWKWPARVPPAPKPTSTPSA